MQAFCDLGQRAVGTADLEPLINQYFRNTAHAYAAYADEM
jgi:hypothetical protein